MPSFLGRKTPKTMLSATRLKEVEKGRGKEQSYHCPISSTIDEEDELVMPS